MFDNFLFNIQYGINYILDLNAYDHVLFLIVLTIPYLFRDWKRIIILVSLFTLGHTVSLLLAVYNIVTVKASAVAFLIPITILVVAIFNILNSSKKAAKNEKVGIVFFSTLFFGLIHGLGFAREFRMLLSNSDSKIIRLLEFALGIGVAQIIIVFAVLLMGYVMQTAFRFNRRDWIMIISAIVVGFVIPMIMNSAYLA